ncbi:heat-shock protein [Deinococcus irradiatisoli]|uniref:Heat-shock protein n=1 Tax=Deinococcus irradiatisoli TaxID=2202254 RepID=A0A2Z3JDT0_9DEIO|nr:Hsp20/alpha crystallin family protein [Deinococcus irradiatisoli]AWN23115.1 heat-shock protein [Deinococcus irradiatisoli]
MDKPVLARLHKVMQLREEVETLASGGPFAPDADWLDSGTHLTLIADVPGCSLESLMLEDDGEAVTLSGERLALPESRGVLHRERRTGRFSRRLPFPVAVVSHSGEASLVSGVLSVRFEKVHKTIEAQEWEEPQDHLQD